MAKGRSSMAEQETISLPVNIPRVLPGSNPGKTHRNDDMRSGHHVDEAHRALTFSQANFPGGRTSSDGRLKTGLSLPLCHKALFVFHRPHSRLFVGHSSCYCSSEAKYLVGSLANKTHKTMRYLAVCFGFLAFR